MHVMLTFVNFFSDLFRLSVVLFFLVCIFVLVIYSTRLLVARRVNFPVVVVKFVLITFDVCD